MSLDAMLIAFTAVIALAACVQAWSAWRQAKTNRELANLTAEYVALSRDLVAGQQAQARREETAALANLRARVITIREKALALDKHLTNPPPVRSGREAMLQREAVIENLANELVGVGGDIEIQGLHLVTKARAIGASNRSGDGTLLRELAAFIEMIDSIHPRFGAAEITLPALTILAQGEVGPAREDPDGTETTEGEQSQE